MAGRSAKDYIRAVFEPLVIAADRLDLLEQLKTADLPESKKARQFQKIKTFNFCDSNIVDLPNGGFLCLYSNDEGQFAALSSSGLNSQEEEEIERWVIDEDLELLEMDECTFLRLSYDLKGYMRLEDGFRAKSKARDAIDVIDINYIGHKFEDIYNMYQRVFIIKIPVNSTYYNCDIFNIASNLCCNHARLRSQIVDYEVSSLLLDILEVKYIVSENVFLAVTSSQWRHFFLEIYRYIESMFYLPWVLDLKSIASIPLRASELKKYARSSLDWREKERPSIKKLFSLIPRDAEIDSAENKIELFKEFKNSDEFNQEMLGNKIYNIRNSLVHHEDYDDPAPLSLLSSEWRALSIYLILIVLRLHNQYGRDLSLGATETQGDSAASSSSTPAHQPA